MAAGESLRALLARHMSGLRSAGNSCLFIRFKPSLCSVVEEKCLLLFLKGFIVIDEEARPLSDHRNGACGDLN